MRKTLLLSTAAVLFSASIVFAGGLNQNVATYKQNANEVLKAVVSGEITQQNADQYITQVDQLITLGKDIATEIGTQKAEGKELLDFVVKNGDQAKSETVDVITAKWHHGEAFKAAGIDHDKFDHYGAVIAAKDAYVQSITSYVALKEFKANGDAQKLDTVREELEEVLGQLQYINK